MKSCYRRYLARIVIASVALIGVLVWGGCADDLTGQDPSEAEWAAGKLDPGDGKAPRTRREIAAWAKRIQKLSRKTRHFHLLHRAIVYSAAGKAGSSSDSVRLVVGFSDGSATADSVLQAVLNKHKILNRYEYKTALHGMAVSVPVESVEPFVAEIDTLSSVSWTEPDPTIPLEPGGKSGSTASTQQIPWGIPNVGADVSWTASGDGTGAVDVDLFILDTGVSNPDVNVVECLEITRKSGAVVCSTADDADGHGTAVAAVAAARDNHEGIVGVAPGARVHAIKVMREYGKTVLGSLVAVVDYLTNRKLANPSVPMVVNISLGSTVKTTRYNGLDEAIRASIAAGVVYVISAGNDGVDASHVTPAHVAEAITVGAYDQSGQFAWFSNYGSVVDILAPGHDVLTLTPSNTLTTISGTSFSAPYVAGAAALLLATDPTLTPAQVRDRIVAAGRTIVTGVPTGTTNKALYVQ